MACLLGGRFQCYCPSDSVAHWIASSLFYITTKHCHVRSNEQFAFRFEGMHSLKVLFFFFPQVSLKSWKTLWHVCTKEITSQHWKGKHHSTYYTWQRHPQVRSWSSTIRIICRFFMLHCIINRWAHIMCRITIIIIIITLILLLWRYYYYNYYEQSAWNC